MPNLRKHEVVVVVDDSPLEEQIKLKKCLQIYDAVILIQGTLKGGRGYAVWRGMQYILREFPKVTHLLEMDCDGSHRIEDILLISECSENQDFIIGSRYLPESLIFGWSFSRRVLSRFLNTLIPLLLDLDVRDVTNGLRRYSRKSAQILVEEEPIARGFIYLSEQASLLKSRGIIASEVAIVFASRIAGKSSVTLKDLAVSLTSLLQILIRRR